MPPCSSVLLNHRPADPCRWTAAEHTRATLAVVTVMSPAQIAALPWPAWLPAEVVAGLSVEQLLAIPVRLWGLMPGDWLLAVSPERLAALPPDRVAWWTAEATARLDAVRVRRLSPDQMAALRWPEALTLSAVAVLSPAQIRACAYRLCWTSSSWRAALSPEARAMLHIFKS